MQAAAVRRVAVGCNKHNLAAFVGNAKREHLGHERADLTRREIHHRHHFLPDLSMTLKEIDKRLATAEEWGRTFRVLDGGSASDGEDANAGGFYDPGDQGPVENGPGGRYQ